jgi:hypothetical protein
MIKSLPRKTPAGRASQRPRGSDPARRARPDAGMWLVGAILLIQRSDGGGAPGHLADASSRHREHARPGSRVPRLVGRRAGDLGRGHGPPDADKSAPRCRLGDRGRRRPPPSPHRLPPRQTREPSPPQAQQPGPSPPTTPTATAVTPHTARDRPRTGPGPNGATHVDPARPNPALKIPSAHFLRLTPASYGSSKNPMIKVFRGRLPLARASQRTRGTGPPGGHGQTPPTATCAHTTPRSWCRGMAHRLLHGGVALRWPRRRVGRGGPAVQPRRPGHRDPARPARPSRRAHPRTNDADRAVTTARPLTTPTGPGPPTRGPPANPHDETKHQAQRLGLMRMARIPALRPTIRQSPIATQLVAS